MLPSRLLPSLAGTWASDQDLLSDSRQRAEWSSLALSLWALFRAPAVCRAKWIHFCRRMFFICLEEKKMDIEQNKYKIGDLDGYKMFNMSRCSVRLRGVPHNNLTQWLKMIIPTINISLTAAIKPEHYLFMQVYRMFFPINEPAEKSYRLKPDVVV